MNRTRLRQRSLRWVALLCSLAALAAGMHLHRVGAARAQASAAAWEREEQLDAMRQWESARRDAVDFATMPPHTDVTGVNPAALVRSTAGYVCVLRGASEVVFYDATLAESRRQRAPEGACGVSTAGGLVAVVGDLNGSVAFYSSDGRRRLGLVALPGAVALRDVALVSEDVLVAVDVVEHRLHWLRFTQTAGGAVQQREHRTLPLPRGPFQVRVVGDYVLALSLLDHALSVLPLDAAHRPVADRIATVSHDGPMWSVDALPIDGGLRVVAGGVEDHPLDRSGGFFGYIDSFVFVVDFLGDSLQAVRRVATNVSEFGVITPKAVSILSVSPLVCDVSGAGGDVFARIEWDSEMAARATTYEVPPGVSAFVRDDDRIVAANPLLDALVDWRVPGDGWEVRPVVVSTGREPTRTARLGEALFFSRLMAPWNSSTGALSRFTCETCHFEGGVDGRTHFTGRGDVHATTKPLLGLFNNKPHFSRALDRDLTQMVDAEFRVAGAHSGTSPWFSIAVAEHPWLEHLGWAVTDSIDAITLRRSLAEFLMGFTHAPNPRVLERSKFDAHEVGGADLFARHCERCHAARLVADRPETRVDPGAWEGLVFAREGAIVWGSDGYRKTGVLPYVHEEGARTPSLRRLDRKYPYLTNGSARSLDGLLEEVLVGPTTGFSHVAEAASDTLRPLGAEARQALRAFLSLL